MSGIPEATPIVLTDDERRALEGLARSGKTEHRLRQRSRIVLLAADGVATRALARAIGCTTGSRRSGVSATPGSAWRASPSGAPSQRIAKFAIGSGGDDDGRRKRHLGVQRGSG
jgi:hypothetical protein